MRFGLPLCTAAFLVFAPLGLAADPYYPPPDAEGGWRTPASAEQAPAIAGVDVGSLDEAFHYARQTSKNGGLLVIRRGWLVYERYFGLAHRDATPNHASIGKSFTSIAAGILLGERPDVFPDGLDQKVFRETYLPPQLFPVDDPRKREIKLGQLLAMTAGIRGNNPAFVRGEEASLDPPGPDGWEAMVDETAFHVPLWCDPGDGYSYATASAQLASMVVRKASGVELEEYVRRRLAEPMGWGRWGWGYRQRIREHTPGGGGIAVRPTDLARFGYLLLHDGRWGDRQLAPAEYVRHCRRPSPYNPHSSYSLQFNVNGRGEWPKVPSDAFWKTGSGGFCLYMIPSLDLVVFKMGGRDDQYDPANTGLEPALGAPAGEAREDWRPPVDTASDPYERLLELVLEALR